jgi:hypothetical protein
MDQANRGIDRRTGPRPSVACKNPAQSVSCSCPRSWSCSCSCSCSRSCYYFSRVITAGFARCPCSDAAREHAAFTRGPPGLQPRQRRPPGVGNRTSKAAVLPGLFFASRARLSLPDSHAWSTPRRSDGAGGRFSPGVTCRSMNRLVSRGEGMVAGMIRVGAALISFQHARALYRRW